MTNLTDKRHVGLKVNAELYDAYKKLFIKNNKCKEVNVDLFEKAIMQYIKNHKKEV